MTRISFDLYAWNTFIIRKVDEGGKGLLWVSGDILVNLDLRSRTDQIGFAFLAES